LSTGFIILGEAAMQDSHSTLTTSCDGRLRTFTALGLGLLALVPILATPFPPSTDLPQHIAQVQLLREALATPGGRYIIQWAAPGNLIYGILSALLAVLPPIFVAQAVLALIVLAWTAAIHRLAGARARPIAAAVLASALIFNQSLYWGFINFLTGFPVFVLWFWLTTKEDRKSSWQRWLALAGTAFLLYESHALWFAAGCVWLVLAGFIKKTSRKEFLLSLTTLMPSGLAAVLWYPNLSAARAKAGFDVGAHWSPLFDRLASFLDAAFGGMRGPVETMAFLFIYFWVGVAIWQNRKHLRASSDDRLLAASVAFLTLTLAAPDKYLNTIFFSSRWLPTALIFLLLALPAPRFRRPSPKVLALCITAGFFLATTVAWFRYNVSDLRGFRSSLEQITANSRVLGLDLVRESDIIKGRPFLQLSAFAQVLKSCELNFSFAEHYSSLVAFRGRRRIGWTQGLEWYAQNVKRSDFCFFDFVLVNGDESYHKTLTGFPEISPITESGPWRLYKVNTKAGALLR
jgi:hypothetical protein